MGPENEPRRAKKRARSSVASAEPAATNKKQRGRPKVDTQDETAADRRRTQIRLAQRAYRQRKELTISSLQQQVRQLQMVISSMNNWFLNFNKMAIASGTLASNPLLAFELQRTTGKFVELVTAANAVDMDMDIGHGDDPAILDPCPVLQNAPAAPNVPNMGRQHLASMEQDSNFQIKPEPAHINMAYFTTAEDSNVFAYGQNAHFHAGSALPSFPAPDFVEPMGFELHPSQDSACGPLYFQDMPPPGGGDMSQQGEATRRSGVSKQCQNRAVTATRACNYDASANLPAVIHSPWTSSPRPAFTYSFQETSFARRLQRACLERTFQLLSTPKVRPSDFNRVFRLCRHFLPREALLRDFRNLLQQSDLQPLDFLNSPFIHLGGAGTHYPARDRSGKVLPRQTDWNVRRIGPCATRIQLEELRTPRPKVAVTQELEHDLKEYGGEWLDSQDVEGYLEELGVHIDAQASFAETTGFTLDALARLQSPQSELAHPDSELGVLGDALDQSAPNHMTANSDHWPFSQAALGAYSPGHASVPGSSDGPSTPDSANDHQQLFRPLVQPSPPFSDERPAIGTNTWDEWDRFYDLNLAWADGNQADLSAYGLSGMATAVGSVQPWKQSRTVMIDVQRFINGMIKRAVCIGRGPGFRRSDIHCALRAAVVDSL